MQHHGFGCCPGLLPGLAVGLSAPADAVGSGEPRPKSGGPVPRATLEDLAAAARILAAEAYHAGNIRLQIAQNNIATAPPLDGADHLPPPSGALYFPLDANALTEVRTPGEVLLLAFGAANASSGLRKCRLRLRSVSVRMRASLTGPNAA